MKRHKSVSNQKFKKSFQLGINPTCDEYGGIAISSSGQSVKHLK